MANFIFVQCPNCKVKIKIDKDKKYQDCPDCKYEFRIEDVSPIQSAPETNQNKESIFGKFLKENKL